MKRLFFIICLMFVTVACSSTKVKNIDDTLEHKANLGNQQIGVDKEEQAIIQENTAVDDEIRKYVWTNYELERKLISEREDLIRCRTEYADPRLSGNKQMQEIPALEVARDLSKVQESVGLTQNGSLRVIKKELLADRIAKEKNYQESLSNLLKTIKAYRETCNRELGYARVQHGLPAERYPALGYYGAQGNFIVTRAAEHNMDEAFKILAAQSRKAKTADNEQKPATAATVIPEDDVVVEN